MILGLFKKSAKAVTVKRKKGKKTAKPKVKRLKRRTVKGARKTPKLKKTKPRAKKVSRAAKAAPQIVGKVTHYFPHVKAGVILISRGKIVPGDTLQFKGHTTDFKQKVTSIELNNVSIKEAKAGQEVGLLVKSRVRHNDTVYKL